MEENYTEYYTDELPYQSFEEYFTLKNVIIKIIPYTLSLIAGIPLHAILIYRLLTRSSYINRYQRGIIFQSGIDITNAVLVAMVLMVDIYPYLPDESIFWRSTYYLADITQNLSLIAVSLTSVHWKSIFKRHRSIDNFLFGSVTVLSIVFLAEDIVIFFDTIFNFSEFFGEGSWLETISYFIFYGGLFTVNIFCFIVVRNIDSSKLSPNVVRCQRKMYISLLIKSLFLFWCLAMIIALVSLCQQVEKSGNLTLYQIILRIEDIAYFLSGFYPLFDGLLSWWSISGLLMKSGPKVSMFKPSYTSTSNTSARTTSLPVLL